MENIISINEIDINNSSGPHDSGDLTEDELMRCIGLNPETGNTIVYDQFIGLSKKVINTYLETKEKVKYYTGW